MSYSVTLKKKKCVVSSRLVHTN